MQLGKRLFALMYYFFYFLVAEQYSVRPTAGGHRLTHGLHRFESYFFEVCLWALLIPGRVFVVTVVDQTS